MALQRSELNFDLVLGLPGNKKSIKRMKLLKIVFNFIEIVGKIGAHQVESIASGMCITSVMVTRCNVIEWLERAKKAAEKAAAQTRKNKSPNKLLRVRPLFSHPMP